jgi:uncharacterized membrane protein
MIREILHCQREMAKGHRAVHEKRIHQIFVASVLLKGAHALIEIIGGIALALFNTDAIVRWLYKAGRPDWIEETLTRFARTFSGQEHHYYVWFLVSHGVINLALVIGLLRGKPWAYPATFAVLALFIAYQLYRYSFTHDIGLILLSIFDLFVIFLAWHEYRLLRKHLPTH